ncbi:hypothetical protein TD95_000017 [Thielaviopsis punctulata]|uniref:C2H2-type domain-containing protein n=1 Tax=Thielaviopsis punctulata TaxID=72032 RepID=A0A0F4Z6Y9_9PEZI|nr:hypothetical protein TD95_000017 [Thielaviopsis punctulata]
MCPKLFRRVEHLDRHRRVHTKEKPFACAVKGCNKRFGRRHEKLVHSDVPPEQLSKSRKNSRSSAKARTVSPPQSNDSQNEHEGLADAAIQQPGFPPQFHAQHPLPSAGSPFNASTLGSMENRLPPADFSSFVQSTNQMPPPSAFTMAQQIPALPAYTMSSQMAIPSLTTNNGIAGDNSLQILSDMAASSAPIIPVTDHPSLLPTLDTLVPELHRRFDAARSPPVNGISANGFPTGMSSGLNPMATTFDFNIMDDFQTGAAFLVPEFDSSNNPVTWMRGMASRVNSAFPSRMPSPTPDGHGPSHSNGNNNHDSRTFNIPMLSLLEEQQQIPLMRHISTQDYEIVKNRLQDFNSVLPADFVFPSRHTLMRYVQGYVKGMNDNMPILHLPTLHVTQMAPELLLTVASLGAQYRVEPHRSYSLWYAAKAVAMEQVNRRRSSEVRALLPTPANYGANSTMPSPRVSARQTFGGSGERSNTIESHHVRFSSNTPEARLETIQAILLLYAVGLWSAKTILNESMFLQSTLAVLLRDEGLGPDPPAPADITWENWIKRETAIRTKTFAFCYFNLSSIAYDDPPSILFSELFLSLPQSGKLWRAENEWQWRHACQTEVKVKVTLQGAFAHIMSKKGRQDEPVEATTLGLYILAHALMQQIWLLKQSAIRGSSQLDASRNLRVEDVDEITGAIRCWESSFFARQHERAASNGTLRLHDPNNPATQIAHNATELVRLASIKLYTDSHTGKALASRDPQLIARALSNFQAQTRSFQPTPRNERMNRAVFQSIQVLAMLAKVGISFVSQHSTTSWSIQHLLCNFESATLLSRWLITVSIIDTETPLTPGEVVLLEMLRQAFMESEQIGPIDPSLSNDDIFRKLALPIHPLDLPTIRRLAQIVLRIWTSIFRGPHIFNVVNVMADSLEQYANILDNPSMLGVA